MTSTVVPAILLTHCTASTHQQPSLRVGVLAPCVGSDVLACLAGWPTYPHSTGSSPKAPLECSTAWRRVPRATATIPWHPTCCTYCHREASQTGFFKPAQWIQAGCGWYHYTLPTPMRCECSPMKHTPACLLHSPQPPTPADLLLLRRNTWPWPTCSLLLRCNTWPWPTCNDCPAAVTMAGHRTAEDTCTASTLMQT